MGTLPFTQSAFSLTGIISLNSKSRFLMGMALAVACGVSSQVNAGFKELPSTNLVLYSASESGSLSWPAFDSHNPGTLMDGAIAGREDDHLTLSSINSLKDDLGFNLSNSEDFAHLESWNSSAPAIPITSAGPQSEAIVPLLIPLPTAVTSGICGLLALGAVVMPRRLRRRLFS